MGFIQSVTLDHSDVGRYCCRNIAGLIDCFPDIREFCLVLCPHSAIKTDQGHRVVEWYDNRKYTLLSCIDQTE